jgi:alkylation response protein AidB-like acyl-CoA dehydrogenase
MTKGASSEQLAGPIALLKSYTTKVQSYCVNQASQIFGGNSFMRNGQGEKVERIYRVFIFINSRS